MEAILVLFVPIALIWIGLALTQGRAVTPGAIMARHVEVLYPPE